LQQIPNEAERSARAAAIFGKSVAGISNALNLGKQEFAGFLAESDALGNTISTKTAEALGGLDQQINKAAASWDGLKRIIAAEAAPAISAGIDRMAIAFTALRKLLDFDNAGVITGALGGGLFAGGKTPEASGNSAPLAALAAPTASDFKLNTDFAKFVEANTKHRAELEARARDVIEGTLTPLEEYRKKVEEINRLRQAGLLTIEQQRRAVTQAATELQESAPKNALKERAQDRLKDIQTPFERFKSEIAKIQEEFRAGFLDKDHARLAAMQAQADLLAAQPEQQAFTGAFRPAALERGSAAAFSASLAQPGKEQTKLERLTDEMVRLQRDIAAKLGGAAKGI
jgi:hypothetical protein